MNAQSFSQSDSLAISARRFFAASPSNQSAPSAGGVPFDKRRLISSESFSAGSFPLSVSTAHANPDNSGLAISLSASSASSRSKRSSESSVCESAASFTEEIALISSCAAFSSHTLSPISDRQNRRKSCCNSSISGSVSSFRKLPKRIIAESVPIVLPQSTAETQSAASFCTAKTAVFTAPVIPHKNESPSTFAAAGRLSAE